MSEAANPLWQVFFDAHAPQYNDNVFTKDTVHEVDFIEEELRLSPGARILDLGCGTGRHSIELARRGYRVTGLDLSAGMLEEARKSARAAGVQVEWVQGDATQFAFDEPFDAVLGLCEGGLGLLCGGDDAIEQPLSILRNVAGALKPGGKTIFTVLSAFRLVRMHMQEAVADGRFDPLTLSEYGEVSPGEGLSPVKTRERAFVPTELVLLFRAAGMTVLHQWGGTAGAWGRRKIELDEFEIMVVAERPAA